MDAFTQLVTEARAREALRDRYSARLAREAQAAREALLRTEAETVSAYWTARTEAVTASREASEQRQALALSQRQARTNLRQRHTIGLRARANEAQALSANEAAGKWTHDSSYRACLTRRHRLSLFTRDLVRFAVNSETRVRLYTEISALGDPAETLRVGTDRADTYGAVTAREARVNVRGAYGLRGVKGTASAVTTRDHHAPALALRPLSLAVGHATATQGTLTQAQASELTLALRRDPSLCSVRVRHGAPWIIVGQTIEQVTYVRPSQALPEGTVKPLSEYRTEAARKAEAAREAAQVKRAQALSRERSLRLSVAGARLARDLDAQGDMVNLSDALALAEGTA